MTSSSDDILLEKIGRAGVITLNRPKALNALTHGMVRLMTPQLKAWAADPSVRHVVIRQAGDRAFCAGGDLRGLVESIRAQRFADAETFFRDEYRLNRLIKRFPKPYVALIDGIVMGGGVGVSVHGSHRVGTERLSFAMPEVGIGFFPDVGATWFLPRLPGELGTYCALTGDRFNAADALAGGIATQRVPTARFPALLEALYGTGSVDATLAAFSELAGEGPITARRPAIDRLFSGDRVEDILARLDQESGEHAEWARSTAATIRTKSPLSLKLALAQVRRGKDWDFSQCMQTEFRIVSRVIRGHDFYEGVRAVIIDKDNKPRWQPATLAEVTDADVERHFADLGGDGLKL